MTTALSTRPRPLLSGPPDDDNDDVELYRGPAAAEAPVSAATTAAAAATTTATSRRRGHRWFDRAGGGGDVGESGVATTTTSRSSSSSWRSDNDIGDDVECDGEQEGVGNEDDDDVEMKKSLIVDEEERRRQRRRRLQQQQPSTWELVRQFIAVLFWTIVSWNLPRYLIANETSIVHKSVPFQLVGDAATQQQWVILDAELNHPLVDPPTIPSDLLVYTSLGVPLLVIVLVAWLTKPAPLTSTSTSSSHSVLPYSSFLSNGEEEEGATSTAKKDNKLKNDDSGRDRIPPLSVWFVTLHAAICGALMAIALTEGPTQLLKLYVQRPRPNFYALCGFDMVTRTCTAPVDQQRDATFSFPSGHSSLAMLSMTFVALLLVSRFVHSPPSSSSKRGLRRQGRWTWLQSCLDRRTWALLAVILPLSWSVFVGASRIVDHWHHPSDVLTGLLLGFVGGSLSYHYWFPPVWIPTTSPWSLHDNRRS